MSASSTDRTETSVRRTVEGAGTHRSGGLVSGKPRLAVLAFAAASTVLLTSDATAVELGSRLLGADSAAAQSAAPADQAAAAPAAFADAPAAAPERQAAVAAPAAAALPAAAVQAAEPGRAVLAATTVLTGTASAVVPVRLTKPATFRQPQADPKSNAVAVEGKGRFVGFALVEQSADPDRTVIISGRVPSRLRAGKTTDLTSSALSSRHGGVDPVWTLPKGDYNLYLLTDGSPAKVTLRLGGLAGSSTLKPTRKAAFTVKQPAERLVGQGASSAGDNAVTRGETLTFGWLGSRYQPVLNEDVQHCRYYDAAPSEESKFRTGCLGAAESSAINVANVDLGPAGIISTSFGYDRRGGDHGQGYALLSAGLRESLDYTAVWLDLSPAAPAKPAPAAAQALPGSGVTDAAPRPARAAQTAAAQAPGPAAQLPATGPSFLAAAAPALLLGAALARRTSKR